MKNVIIITSKSLFGVVGVVRNTIQDFSLEKLVNKITILPKKVGKKLTLETKFSFYENNIGLPQTCIVEYENFDELIKSLRMMGGKYER